MPRTVTSGNMVYLAPARHTPERQSRDGEQVAAAPAEDGNETATDINPEAVAERVYRLMQRDLKLERERATRLGG